MCDTLGCEPLCLWDTVTVCLLSRESGYYRLCVSVCLWDVVFIARVLCDTLRLWP